MCESDRSWNGSDSERLRVALSASEGRVIPMGPYGSTGDCRAMSSTLEAFKAPIIGTQRCNTEQS